MSGADPEWNVAVRKLTNGMGVEALSRAIEFHEVRPVIDSRYAFERLPDALRHLQSGRHMGKIVITFR